MTAFIGTTNPGFAPFAMEELRRRWPDVSLSGLAPGETFKFSVAGADDRALVRALRMDEPIFLRHLFPVREELDIPPQAEEVASALVRFAGSLADEVKGAKVAVQVRKSQSSPFPFSSAEARDLMVPALLESGAETVSRGAKWIVSVYASKRSLYLGLSAPADNLSDWPGGAVRFRREEGLISRAAFKLLEAEQTFDLPFERFTNALDLGAAPGGWTSVLLERGLRVTAVDPAEMDESLAGHPRLRHLRQNAADLSFAPGTFDLLVCDMSWDPHHTARIVKQLAPSLSAGASVIVTLKLMYKKPMQTIADLLGSYEETFDIRRVKQLFHNRDEATVWMRK